MARPEGLDRGDGVTLIACYFQMRGRQDGGHCPRASNRACSRTPWSADAWPDVFRLNPFAAKFPPHPPDPLTGKHTRESRPGEADPEKRRHGGGEKKFCFVVCPVGPRGSETRDRMDGIFNEVVAPVVEEFGYRAEIAIHDKSPGIVTEGIVAKLIEADLVIVDLHGHNGNVMYGMALRHATGEPIIQMIPEGEELPFDIAGSNTVTYDFSVHRLARWRKDLRTALQTVADGRAASNPVARASMVRGLQAVARTSMFPGLQAQVGSTDVVLEDSSPQVERPQVERPRDDLRRGSVQPGLLWKSSVTRSGWMNELHRALATHSPAGMLDSFRVDLEEVDGDLIRVVVQEVDGDERSETRVISRYRIRAFEEDAAEVAQRIWARVDLDVRRIRDTEKNDS